MKKNVNLKRALCLSVLSSQILYAGMAVAEPADDQLPLVAPAPAVIADHDVPAKPVLGKKGVPLKDILEKALVQSPRLKSFSHGVTAAEGLLRQSSAWTNPEIGVQADNLSGTGAYKGFNSAELTYGVSQEIPISGKISAREKVAEKDLQVATLDEQAAKLDLVRDVTIAFIDAVAAEETVRLATEQKDLAEDVLRSVSIRVGAAASPLIQKSRAQVERSTATIALDKAQRERTITRKKLAALVGENDTEYPLEKDSFYQITNPKSHVQEAQTSANPDIAKLDVTLEKQKARIALEEANAIPDPRVNIGMRDFRASGDQAFLVGLSIPIPIFNANRGNIQAAQSTANRTEYENRQYMLNTRSDVVKFREQLKNAYMQATMLKTEMLPAAQQAFRLAREGYGQGRFPYLEVLDAQRSLFGVKQQQVDSIRDFHTANAVLERLTVAHTNAIPSSGAPHAE